MLTDTPSPVAEEPGASAEAAQTGPSPATSPEATAPAPSEGIATPTTPAADPSDPYTAAGGLDPEKLLEAHPGLKRYLDSKAGEVGDRLSKRQVEQERARIREEYEREQHQRYLDSLVDQDDLVGLGELAKRQRLAERNQRQQSEASQQVARHAEATLGQAVVGAFSSLPNHLQAVLYNEDGKTFRRWAPGGTVADGIAEMLKAAIDRGVDAEIKRRFPGVKSALEEAVQRERNGAALGEEPSPDTRPGAPAGTRVVTDRDLRNIRSMAEYDALFPPDRKGLPADGVIYRPNG